MPPVRVLCVDDEPAIQQMMPAVLGLHGFEVTSTATVAEALSEIALHPFDVLIADLNIGSPGDGFTVVSAMRRTHPDCINLILTGYPAFETALQAIRSQVDDYLLKPTDIPHMVALIEQKLKDREPHRPLAAKRISSILRENVFKLTQRTLKAMKAEPAMAALPFSDEKLLGHMTLVLNQLAEMLESSDPDEPLPSAVPAARLNGEARYQEGYSIPALIALMRLLGRVIFDVVNENLLLMDLSYLMPDLKRVYESMALQLEETVQAYLEAQHSAA